MDGERKMREIKFRIWNKNHKKMIYFDSPSLKIDHDSGLHFKARENHIYLSGYADDIMQYAEFKDRNSNEIYDGDILKINDDGKEYIGVVEYYGSGFRVKYGTFKEFIGFVARYSEVIGNIYKNPELLEG